MVAAFAAISALACASAAPREPTVLAKVPERVVILPLNVTAPMPAELSGASPDVWTALEIYLRANGTALKTLAPAAARGLWLASIRDAQGKSQLSKAGYDDAARVFVGKLRSHAEFDAVIVPSLFVSRAILSGTKASWDGMEQTLEFETPRGQAQVSAEAPIEGAAPAASLHMAVFDAEGAKLQESRAGLALLVRARITPPSGARTEATFSFLPRRDPFDDRESLVRGVARALAPFVSPLPDSELRELAARFPAEPPGRAAEAPPQH